MLTLKVVVYFLLVGFLFSVHCLIICFVISLKMSVLFSLMFLRFNLEFHGKYQWCPLVSLGGNGA